MIARIREVDPLLHAVVEDRFEAALDDARQADKELAACTDVEELANKKPFLGVPFTVKDSISVQGRPKQLEADLQPIISSGKQMVLIELVLCSEIEVSPQTKIQERRPLMVIFIRCR